MTSRLPVLVLVLALSACASTPTASRTDAPTLEQPAASLPEPSYAPGVRWCDLSGCLPDYAVAAIREAIPAFDRQIAGFAMHDAVLTGVETRTSSPVRITRNDGYESVSTAGLYPAGEGAGYAGGIVSAAVDGIKVAEAVALSIVQVAAAGGAGA